MALAATIIVATLAGCPYEDPFAEYRGVNLIAEQEKSVDDFEEAYLDGSDPASTPDYSLLEIPASYGPTAGLPDTTGATLDTIRRLELVNLLPNGDFEDGTTDPWIADGSGLTVSAPNLFTVKSDGELPESYIGFEVSAGQGAAVDLDSLPIPVVNGGRYFLQFLAKRDDAETELTLDFGDNETTSYNDLNGVSWNSPGPGDGSTPGPEEFPDPDVPRRDLPTQFVVSSTPNYLYLGSPKTVLPQAGFIDNVRIGRMDIMPVRALTLETKPTTGLELVPGTYSFSVWVKSEVDDEVTPATRNRYRSDRIALGANGRLELFLQADHGWSPTEWVKLTTTVELSQEEISAEDGLSLQLTTIHPQRPSVGSILIARPELTLGTE